MNHGDRREDVFRDDQDRERFIATLAEACAKADWQVHAYCLMGNHFHLVVETPKWKLVAGMKWFLGTYTPRLNRRHKLFGHLFSRRYKSLVDSATLGYLKTVCDYAHLNPLQAAVVTVNGQTFCMAPQPFECRAAGATNFGRASNVPGLTRTANTFGRAVRAICTKATIVFSSRRMLSPYAISTADRGLSSRADIRVNSPASPPTIPTAT